jgi:hypothetical protein
VASDLSTAPLREYLGGQGYDARAVRGMLTPKVRLPGFCTAWGSSRSLCENVMTPDLPLIDAQNRLDKVTTANDDGTRVLLDHDQAAANPRATVTTVYDVQMRLKAFALRGRHLRPRGASRGQRAMDVAA